MSQELTSTEETRGTQPQVPPIEQMKTLVQEKEPDKLSLLKTGPGISETYAMSSAILKTENLELKGELAKILIEKYLDQGLYSAALDLLTFGGIPETELPEYQNYDFPGRLYDQAMTEGEYWEAWRIASIMITEEKRSPIIKKEPAAPDEEADVQEVKEMIKYRTGWETREINSFEAHVGRVLERQENGEDVILELELLHNAFFFRPEGYFADQPSELSQKLARAYCQALTKILNRAWLAPIAAAEARLPLTEISKFKSERLPERIKGYLENLKRALQETPE